MNKRFGQVTDLKYAAIEPIDSRIRLAYDGKGMVYIIDNSNNACSAPFDMAIKFKCIFNDKMEFYYLNEHEISWLNKISAFARILHMETV